MIRKMRNYQAIVQRDFDLRSRLKNESRKAARNGDLQAAFKLRQKLNSIRRISSPVRVRNVCQITGRTRGVFSLFGLCGQEIKRASSKGLLFGLRLVSW